MSRTRRPRGRRQTMTKLPVCGDQCVIAQLGEGHIKRVVYRHAAAIRDFKCKRPQCVHGREPYHCRQCAQRPFRVLRREIAGSLTTKKSTRNLSHKMGWGEERVLASQNVMSGRRIRFFDKPFDCDAGVDHHYRPSRSRRIKSVESSVVGLDLDRMSSAKATRSSTLIIRVATPACAAPTTLLGFCRRSSSSAVITGSGRLLAAILVRSAKRHAPSYTMLG